MKDSGTKNRWTSNVIWEFCPEVNRVFIKRKKKNGGKERKMLKKERKRKKKNRKKAYQFSWKRKGWFNRLPVMSIHKKSNGEVSKGLGLFEEWWWWLEVSKSWSKGRKELSSFYLPPPSLHFHEHELWIENCEQRIDAEVLWTRIMGLTTTSMNESSKQVVRKMNESKSRTRTPKVEPGIEKYQKSIRTRNWRIEQESKCRRNREV